MSVVESQHQQVAGGGEWRWLEQCIATVVAAKDGLEGWLREVDAGLSGKLGS